MCGADKSDANAMSTERNEPDPTIVAHDYSNASRALKVVSIVARNEARVMIDRAPTEAFDEFQSATSASHDAPPA
jgi:hypothetical protein